MNQLWNIGIYLEESKNHSVHQQLLSLGGFGKIQSLVNIESSRFELPLVAAAYLLREDTLPSPLRLPHTTPVAPPAPGQ